MDITGVTLASLGRNFNKLFDRGFSEVKPEHARIAVQVPSTTKTNDYAWLSNFPGMREWIGARVLKELSGHTYSITNRKWESTLRVKEDDIEDDNIGLYAPMATALGAEAAQHPDSLVWETLSKGDEHVCFDGQNFFDEDHPLDIDGENHPFSNYTTGNGKAWYLVDTGKPLKPLILQMRQKPRFRALTDPKNERVFMNGELVYGVDARYATGFTFPQLIYRHEGELNAENLEAATLAMNAYKNEAGRPLGIKPNLLIVGSTNQFKARKLIKREKLDNGVDNIHAGSLEVFVAPKLD